MQLGNMCKSRYQIQHILGSETVAHTLYCTQVFVVYSD